MSKRTPLYEQHQKAGAKFTNFFGWEMPLHYGSQLTEHVAVRESAGMFDVSHMTILDLLGTGGRDFLRYLLANDIDKLPSPGRALYSCMLDHRGGVLDDLIAYYRAADSYRLVLNCATREADIAWIQEQVESFSVGIQQRPELAIIAVQGPDAIKKSLAVMPAAVVDAASTLEPFAAIDIDGWYVSRTGYTGEDGFEIIIPEEIASDVWQKLLEQGVVPCGLGARDSLRLEAGMMLSGQDMDSSVTPLESGLSWTVALAPEERKFIGRATLETQKNQGVLRKMVGLVLPPKSGIMRPGQTVYSGQDEVGVITSGGFSPTCQRSIALARVTKTIGEHCEIDIRSKRISAAVMPPRFVKQGNILIKGVK